MQIIVEPCWISPNICLLFRWKIALRISLRTCSLSSSTQLNANEIWDCWVFYPFLLNSVAAQVHHSTFVHNAWQTAETQMCTKKKKKKNCTISFNRVHLTKVSCLVVSDSLQPHGLQHARLPCPSPTSGACSNSCPWSQWCHPTISSFFVPFSSCLQFFPASGSFPMSQFFASGGQSIGASASASILPINVQDRFPLGWTGFISLQSKSSQESSLTPQFKSTMLLFFFYYMLLLQVLLCFTFTCYSYKYF